MSSSISMLDFDIFHSGSFSILLKTPGSSNGGCFILTNTRPTFKRAAATGSSSCCLLTLAFRVQLCQQLLPRLSTCHRQMWNSEGRDCLGQQPGRQWVCAQLAGMRAKVFGASGQTAVKSSVRVSYYIDFGPWNLVISLGFSST